MYIQELFQLYETRGARPVLTLGTRLWRYITSRLQVKKQISLDIPNPRDPVWQEIYHLSIQHQKAASPEQAQRIEQVLIRKLNGNKEAAKILQTDRFHREINQIDENFTVARELTAYKKGIWPE